MTQMLGRFNGHFVGGKVNAESLRGYTQATKDFVAMLERELQHGRKFLTGDRMATADFFAATYFFSDIYNQCLSD